MRSWLAKIPWRRVGLVVAGGAVTALGVFVPPAAPFTSVIGSGLIGMALPSEIAGKVGGAVVSLVKRR